MTATDGGLTVRGYFARQVSPPISGDGLLIVGLVEGLVGWPLSRAMLSTPALAPFGVFGSIVGLWTLLTALIVAVGVLYTAPVVRRNAVWVVWGVLNLLAAVVNLLAVGGALPADLSTVAYLHPWLAAFGLGYLATAAIEFDNPVVRRSERAVYGLAGLASLAVLGGALAAPELNRTLVGNAFLVGGLLHVAPIAYDVLADVVLAFVVAPRRR